jgi:hypothetical protein
LAADDWCLSHVAVNVVLKTCDEELAKMRKYVLNGLLAAMSTLSFAVAAGSASAQVVEYTSQSAFDAAISNASTFGFVSDGNLDVEPNPVTIGGFDFSGSYTAADTSTGGYPITFIVPAAKTPTYGADFLSFQNSLPGIVSQISSSGADAIGFSYGSYVSTGDTATVTLSTGDTYTINPTSTAQFIGFTSSTPITSVSFNYPSGYALDILSVSSAAPEPATWALMFAGVCLAGSALRGGRPRRRLAAT